jgi:molybdate transport system substrate-binding protein
MTNTQPASRTNASGALRILCAGAMHPIVDALADAFEHASGVRLAAAFASSGGVKARVLAQEAVDVAISTRSVIDELGARRLVMPQTAVLLARSAIGVAVRAGATKPDIGSVEAFRRALRHARTIALADPATGSPSANHLLGVFERLGMSEELRPKLKLAGAPAGKVVVVGEIVANGGAEIGIQQIAEILAVPGVDLVGELPAELQHITVFAGAVAATARDVAQAGRFLDFLASPAAALVIRAKGMAPACIIS